MSDPVDLDERERKAKAATPGPWKWFGNTKMHSVYLATVHNGRRFIMDFERWGMSQAQPRFQTDHRMVKLSEFAALESRLGPQFEVPHRRDFAGIGHPDAEHIADNSPDVILKYIARIRELEAIANEALEGWKENHWGEVDYSQDTMARIEEQRAVVARGIP